MPFSGESLPGVEDVRRARPDGAARCGMSTPRRDQHHVGRAEPRPGLRERARRADDGAGAAQDRPREPRHPARELDVGAPELDDERLPGEPGDETAGQPVGVHEVGVARRPPRGAREREQEERQREGEPRAAAEVADDAVPVRDAVVGKPDGATTATSTPAARACSTASRTKWPATSASSRGYDVVRTTTFTVRAAARTRWERPVRSSRRRRSSRRTSSGRRRSRRSSPRARQ